MKLLKIPPSVHQSLKMFCAKNNTPMWYVAGIAINNELKKRKEEAKSKPSNKK